jgi:BCD family chlorophyll transporter-like MFS transporter
MFSRHVSGVLTGTLNRVMIVEMGVAAWLVSLMVSLPTSCPFPSLDWISFRHPSLQQSVGGGFRIYGLAP